MKNNSRILSFFLVTMLFSIQMFASQRSCPEKCLAIKSSACMDAACLSLACLATSACTVGGAIFTAQSIATCLQVAPIKECIMGSCATGLCAYVTLGLAIELRPNMAELNTACCGRSDKKIESVGAVKIPDQQTMGTASTESRKLQ